VVHHEVVYNPTIFGDFKPSTHTWQEFGRRGLDFLASQALTPYAKMNAPPHLVGWLFFKHALAGGKCMEVNSLENMGKDVFFGGGRYKRGKGNKRLGYFEMSIGTWVEEEIYENPSENGELPTTTTLRRKRHILVRAHEFVAWSTHGPPKKGTRGSKRKVVLHMCHNPRCINPLHLEYGTDVENVETWRNKARLRAELKRYFGEQQGGEDEAGPSNRG